MTWELLVQKFNPETTDWEESLVRRFDTADEAKSHCGALEWASYAYSKYRVYPEPIVSWTSKPWKTTHGEYRAFVDDLNHRYQDELKFVDTLLDASKEPAGYDPEIRDLMGLTHAVITTHRPTSDVLDKANFQAIFKNDLEKRFPDDVLIYPHGDWMTRNNLQVIMRVLDEDGIPTEAALALYEWHERLDQYIVADEELYSSMEHDEHLLILTDAIEGRRRWEIKAGLNAELLAEELLRELDFYKLTMNDNYLREELAKRGWLEEEDGQEDS